MGLLLFMAGNDGGGSAGRAHGKSKEKRGV